MLGHRQHNEKEGWKRLSNKKKLKWVKVNQNYPKYYCTAMFCRAHYTTSKSGNGVVPPGDNGHGAHLQLTRAIRAN